MPTFQQSKRFAACLGLTLTAVLTSANVALASGGSLDSSEVKCRSTSGKFSYIVIRLKTAPSSERMGDSLVYSDSRHLGTAMLTSQASCYEYRTIAPDPTLANFPSPKDLMVCGNLKWNASNSANGGKVASIVPNKANYRTLFWTDSSGALRARLEKNSKGVFSNHFGEDLTCAETVEQ